MNEEDVPYFLRRRYVYHEVGHHVWYKELNADGREYWRRYYIVAKDKMPNDYARSTVEESWAEVYSRRHTYSESEPKSLSQLGHFNVTSQEDITSVI